MNLDINLFVAVMWGTAVIAFSVAIFAWRRRNAGEWAKSFTVLALTISFWSFTYGFEVASPTLDAKLFWAKLEYIGIVTVPVAWFVFGLQYTGRESLLSNQRIAALLIIPFVTLLMVFTNEMHGFHWTSVGLEDSGSLNVLVVSYGFWFWIHSAYSYLLVITGTIMLVLAYLRYPKAYRRQNAALVIGVLLPLAANAVFLSGVLPIPNVDLTTLAFTVSSLLIANAIFRYQLFDIVPVARRTAVDNMRDGMIVLDNQNRVVDINPAALNLFEQDASAMIGQPLADFLQNQTTIVNDFRDVTQTETEVAVQVGGKQRFFDLHISPLRTNDGNINGRLIVFYEITARKETEQALARARDEALEASYFKSELLARVSHELRTPLNVILGYTEMLQEGIFGPITPDQRKPTDKIIESTTFLTRQVNELLDLSRLDVQEINLNSVEFSIESIVKRVIDQMQVLANNKNVSLLSEIQEEMPPTLMGDPDRLKQVLLNLVGNAIKFSEDGTIKLCVFKQDMMHWVIQVSDQGIGIPDEMQSTIFEPFKQVDGSLTRIYPGAGLGLAIVKQLTELMGGKVKVESKIDQGSTFTVVLPLLTPEKGEENE